MVTNSDKLQNGLTAVLGKVEGLISDNTATALGAVAVGSVIGGAVIGSVISSKNKTSASSKKKSRKSRGKIIHTKRGWKQDRKRRSKQKWEVAYQKRKRRKKYHSHIGRHSKKGIHYTKNGQPYKIMANGRARFIKKTKR
jgi:hypothetical protein